MEKVLPDGSIDDNYRIDYLRQHNRGNVRSGKSGVDLMGHTTWGPIDIVSASTGEMKKRYGSICVGKHDDGTGTPALSRKKSFQWYRKVIESNGREL